MAWRVVIERQSGEEAFNLLDGLSTVFNLLDEAEEAGS